MFCGVGVKPRFGIHLFYYAYSTGDWTCERVRFRKGGIYGNAEKDGRRPHIGVGVMPTNHDSMHTELPSGIIIS